MPLSINIHTEFNYLKGRSDQDVIFETNTEYSKVFCVLDGHGSEGMLFAELAKFKINKYLKDIDEIIQEDGNINEFITWLFEIVDFELSQMKPFNKTGSTCTLVIFTYNKMYVANVGDSSVYMHQNNMMYRLSKEHELNDIDESHRILTFCKNTKTESEYGQIVYRHSSREFMEWDGNPITRDYIASNRMGSPAMYLNYYYNSEYVTGLNMSRSLGDPQLKKAGVIGTPDISVYDLPHAGSKILIGSDGFWDCWAEKELKESFENEIKWNNIFCESVQKSTAVFGDSKDDNSLIKITFN